MNYKKLGDYIQEVTVRNMKDNIDTLLGINIEKYFMPSVANVIGTDLSRYKIVNYKQFACNRMHVGRDKRLPIALSDRIKSFIVSPAYDVFEVIDVNILLPDYLMLWFLRKEFDRNVWFYTDADVRGGLSWESFINIELPIPSIEKQREIVAEYNALQKRIDLNNQLIQKLEETAQTIYKQWFVDFEFPDENGNPYKSSGGEMIDSELGEIPKGWSELPLKDFCVDMKSGGTPSRTNDLYWKSKDIPWIKTGEIKNNILFASEEFISKEGLKGSSAKLLPLNSVLMSMYGVNAGDVGILKIEATTNQACCAMICKDEFQSSYLYYHLVYNQTFIASQAIGGAQENLSKEFIEKIRIVNPHDNILIESGLKAIIDQKELKLKASSLLKNIQSLLLSKMATN